MLSCKKSLWWCLAGWTAKAVLAGVTRHGLWGLAPPWPLFVAVPSQLCASILGSFTELLPDFASWLLGLCSWLVPPPSYLFITCLLDNIVTSSAEASLPPHHGWIDKSLLGVSTIYPIILLGILIRWECFYLYWFFFLRLSLREAEMLANSSLS